MPTPTTLQNLIQLVRQEANMENNQFVTDQELTTYLNSSLAEMDDIMVTTYENYKLENYQSVLTAPNFTIPTPQECLKIAQVQILGNGIVSSGAIYPWISLPHFNLQDSNRLNNMTPCLYPYAGKVNLSYLWQGNRGIIIYPEVQASGTYRIWWVPKFIDLTGIFDSNGNLTNSGDVLQTQMDQQAWKEYAVVDSCIKIFSKQNLDPSAMMQRKAELKERIIGAMANRDQGQPDFLIHSRNNGWGNCWGPWSSGYSGWGW